jgi:filamentous hemagglutinin family protein
MINRRPATLRAALLLVLSCTHAFAAPTGGVITSGSGSIAHAGSTTTVSQASSRISLNWATFDVAAAETVRFNQPSASAIAVNRIADVNGSRILGNLQANGQVFLINPHGLIFGAGAQVNVGGLVASTLDIADSDLTSGSRHFTGTAVAPQAWLTRARSPPPPAAISRSSVAP